MTAHEEGPHSFLLPRAVPHRVGSYHVQLTPFTERKNGALYGDFGAHVSIGMFDWGGLHIRSLGIKTTGNVELIGMVNLSRSGGRGVSLLGIAAVPTKSRPDMEHGVQYLFGVAVRPIATRVIHLDLNLHYDFTAKHLLPEAGAILKLGERVYATLDGTATVGPGARAELLPGVKFKVESLGFLGFGYRFPVTTAKAFDNQVLVQFETGNH